MRRRSREGRPRRRLSVREAKRRGSPRTIRGDEAPLPEPCADKPPEGGEKDIWCNQFENYVDVKPRTASRFH